MGTIFCIIGNFISIIGSIIDNFTSCWEAAGTAQSSQRSTTLLPKDHRGRIADILKCKLNKENNSALNM